MAEKLRNLSIAVGTSPVLISEEQDGTNGLRNVLTVTNTSTGGQNITVAAGDNVISGAGIFLAPGGVYSDSSDAGYKPTQRRVLAVASAAGGAVAIHERIL